MAFGLRITSYISKEGGGTGQVSLSPCLCLWATADHDIYSQKI